MSHRRGAGTPSDTRRKTATGRTVGTKDRSSSVNLGLECAPRQHALCEPFAAWLSPDQMLPGLQHVYFQTRGVSCVVKNGLFGDDTLSVFTYRIASVHIAVQVGEVAAR